MELVSWPVSEECLYGQEFGLVQVLRGAKYWRERVEECLYGQEFGFVQVLRGAKYWRERVERGRERRVCEVKKTLFNYVMSAVDSMNHDCSRF